MEGIDGIEKLARKEYRSAGYGGNLVTPEPLYGMLAYWLDVPPILHVVSLACYPVSSTVVHLESRESIK